MSSRTRSVWPLAVLAVLWLATAPSVAADNNYLHCGEIYIHYNWSSPAVTYQRPGTWAASYRTAIDNAAADFRNNSVFDYNLVSSGATAPWADYNNADTTIAGAAALSLNSSTCRIVDLSLYLNFPHFAAAAHTTDQKQCTAVHEFAHGVGLTHVTTGTSVMLVPHSTRCHSLLIKVLQSVDKTDITGLY